MLIFQSLKDVILDSILDLNELSLLERYVLIASVYGVPFTYFTKDQQTAFRTGVKKWLGRYKSLAKFYERG